MRKHVDHAGSEGVLLRRHTRAVLRMHFQVDGQLDAWVSCDVDPPKRGIRIIQVRRFHIPVNGHRDAVLASNNATPPPVRVADGSGRHPTDAQHYVLL